MRTSPRCWSRRVGSTSVNFQMESYVYKHRPDVVHIINLGKGASRCIASIEYPGEVFAISFRPFGQRAVQKFAHYTEATPTTGRFTPGAFTNQIQSAFREPRLLIVTDSLTDHQPVTEASYVNKFIDIAIPCNTKSPHSIGLIVLRLRGKITHDKWDVKPDLFFYRDPEEAEKEQAAIEAAPAANDLYPEEPLVVEKTNWAGDDAGRRRPRCDRCHAPADASR